MGSVLTLSIRKAYGLMRRRDLLLSGAKLETAFHESKESLLTYIARYRGETNAMVLNYLENGRCYIAAPMVLVDPISGSLDPSGLHIYTDGAWEWTSLLIYYYREYGLRLESEFVKRMESYGYKCPSVSDATIAEIMRH